MKPAEPVSGYLSRQNLLAFFLIFLGFLIGTQLSYYFYTEPAVFPIQSGVALAGLVLAGIRFWPAIFLAGLISYFWSGSSPLLALTYAVGNTAQAVLGAYVLKHLEFNPALPRMRDIFGLVGVAVSVSLVVPIVGVAGFEINELLGGSGLPIAWSAWWVGHMTSLLIVSPFLIRWFTRGALPSNGRDALEIMGAILILIALTSLSSFAPIENIGGIPVGLFVLIPLFWISLRQGPAATTLALLVTSVLIFIGTALGLASPNNPLPLGRQLLSAQISLAVIAFLYFTITAIAEERRSAVRALRGKISRLEDFIAVFAHEIRNPLSPLVSSVELLQMRSSDSETRATVQVMEKHLTTTRRLIDDLLDMSRASKQKIHIEREPAELGKIIGYSLAATKDRFEKRGQRISAETTKEPLRLNADPMRLQQVFTNLLNNASKFSESGSTIFLNVVRRGEEAEVRVRDNGVGIAPEMLDTIFEPFVQLENHTVAERGLGIGLALAREILEQHNGSIRAESEGEGRGSEFIVRLPLSG